MKELLEEAKRELFAVGVLQVIIETKLEDVERLNKESVEDVDPIEGLKKASKAEGISEVLECLLVATNTLINSSKEKAEKLEAVS